MNITKIFTFDAAHKLPLHHGKCKNLHGHTYKLEVTVNGELKKDGMVIDFVDLKKIVKNQVLDDYDHKYINDFMNNSTVENIVKDIWNRLQDYLSLYKIKLWETPTCYAELKK